MTQTFPKMNPKVKRRWVKALRSGRYRQGVGQLRGVDDNGRTVHCCLGVLCELRGKKFDDFRAQLPPSARKWAGISDRATETQYGTWTAQDLLGQANDGEFDMGKWGFKRIATWIEKNL